jgi:hypothetical protein
MLGGRGANNAVARRKAARQSLLFGTGRETSYTDSVKNPANGCSESAMECISIFLPLKLA